MGIWDSKAVLLRIPFVIPILLGNFSNSVVWVFIWWFFGIVVFKAFRKADASLATSTEIYRGKSKTGLTGEEIFSDKSKYSGDYHMGVAHGQGIMTFADGSIYEGQWENGKYNGPGKWTGEDGSFYDGEWRDCLAHGKGKRVTALGNMFEGTFESGRPLQGVWTSPGGAQTPYLAESCGDMATGLPPVAMCTDSYLFFALEMYLHIIFGFLIAYYIGCLNFWGLLVDLLLLVPVLEWVVHLESNYRTVKDRVGLTLRRNNKTKVQSSSVFEIDPSLLKKLFDESRMDTINVEYEWFNYTLAQFWHTYTEWIDEYVRMQIEQNTGSVSFLTLHECTLGKNDISNMTVTNKALCYLIYCSCFCMGTRQSPITVTNMRSSPRNSDPKLREERAQDAATTDEDLIVDLYFDIDWRSDTMIKLKLFGLVPISVEDIFLKASLRVVLQWVALDHNDPGQFPNLAYLGLESRDRADLSLSLKLFGFFDLFSIPPLGTLLAQDFLLDLVYDLLGPGTGYWIDFLRGVASEPFAIIDARASSAAYTKLLRKVEGDVKGLKEATADSKLQVSMTVVASQGHPDCTTFCVLRMGTKAQVEAKEAKDIERTTKHAKSGKSASWSTETFSWLSNPSLDPINEDWLSVRLMKTNLMGGSSVLGVWKASLADLIHEHDLKITALPKTITCTLSNPKVAKDKQGQTEESEIGLQSLQLEVSLSGLGFPDGRGEPLEGKKLADLADTEKTCRGILHVQLKDCQNLHYKMNQSMDKKSDPKKLEPYVKFYVGARRDFEIAFAKHGGLNIGILAKPRQDIEHEFLKQQSTRIEAGQEVKWNDKDGKFIFEADIAAADLCVLAQVFQDDGMLGQTFIEVQDMEFDCNTSRFVLKDEDMVRILKNEDHVIIPQRYHGSSTSDVGRDKTFEGMMKNEVPFATVFVSFVPRIYFRPSLKIVVKSAKGLPKMETFGKADPFVVVSLARDALTRSDNSRSFQTDVVHQDLNPAWEENNEGTFRMDPEASREEVLSFTVMDYERIRAAREMGKWETNLFTFFNGEVTVLMPDGSRKQKKTRQLELRDNVELSLKNSDSKDVGKLYCRIRSYGNLWGGQ